MATYRDWARERAELMRKNAGHGGVLYFPPGALATGDETGRSNADIAREVLDYALPPQPPADDDGDEPHIVQG